MSKAARQADFLRLLDEHRKILYKVSSAYCRNHADRQDLVQEIVVQLWRSFERYDARLVFSTWMYRIALNVAISTHRSEARRSRHTVPVGDQILEMPAEAFGSAEPDEDLQRLQRFIGQLGEMDRALIVLYLDGQRYDAIASIFGISATNVGTKINRIKHRLRRDFASKASRQEESK